MAYEAAIRSLQNRVVPTSAAIMSNEGNPISFFSLNEYLIPGNPPIDVYVTADASVYHHGDLLTDAVFAKAIGFDFVHYQDLICAAP